MLRASSEGPSFATEEFMGKLVLGVVTLALSAGTASAQGYGYDTPKIPSANRANTDA